MHITVVGAGYVGIATAVGLATLGHKVHCVDINHLRIHELSCGICPIYEPEVAEKLQDGSIQNLLSFDTQYRKEDKVFFLTVGTPALKQGAANLDQLFAAVDQIIETIPPTPHALLIIKSTVPIGTHAKITTYLKQKACQHQIASNPEFLREGKALHDCLHPNRIIVGTNDAHVTTILTTIYQSLIDQSYPYLITDPNTAELIKYASNAFLATKLALINELADLCEKAKANVSDLTLGIGLDPRIGKDYLKVGPGFGGSCLPKDIQALRTSFRKYGTPSKILPAVITANAYRVKHIVTKIKTILGVLQHKTITVYGLTFKADTDDIRESPAVKIIEALAAEQAIIHCYDPKATYTSLPDQYKNHIQWHDQPEQAIQGAVALIIATEWKLFQQLDFDFIKSKMQCPIIIDLRNLLDSALLQRKGFQYYALGYPC